MPYFKIFYSKAGFDTIKALTGIWSGMHRHNILEHACAVVQNLLHFCPYRHLQASYAKALGEASVVISFTYS